MELTKEEINASTRELATEANIESEHTYIKFGKFGPYVLIDDLANDLMNSFKFKTVFGRKSEDIWVYDKGTWKLQGREIIKTQVEIELGSYCKIKAVNEVIEKIKRSTAISYEEFDKVPENLLCLENGILNVETLKIEEHSPDYYFKFKIPVKYNKEVDCKEIKKFLSETFYEEDIPVIQEWFGFELYKRYFIKKALIVFGPRDTSKTVFLNLNIAFVGEKNKVGIPLQKIVHGKKFDLAHLKGKLANLYDDLSFYDMKDGGGFKIATGGGYISGEYKFGDNFEFLNYAKHLFACNHIPSLDNPEIEDDAYYSRWIPIPCDNQVSEEKQDPFLIKKLTTEQELSGLLNYALIGLKRLLKNGRFSFNKTPEEIKKLMESHSNSLAKFVNDCLIKKEDSVITKEQMFEMYSYYAEKNGLKRLSKSQLGRQLESKCNFIIAKKTSIRFWEGAEINPTLDKDTLDTFTKIMREPIRNSLKGIDMYISKVSNPTKNEVDNQTL